MPADSKSIAEQYDLGSLGQEVPDDTPEVMEPVAPTDGRARRPDGTFLPKETKIVHPPFLTRRAKDLGMSDAEIEATPSSELDHIIYQATEQWRLNALSREVNNPRGDIQEPAVAPIEEPDELDSVNPAIVKRLKALEKAVADARKEAAEARAETRQRHQESLEEKVDRVFEESPELFGTGRGRDMDRDGVEFAKRMAVLGLAEKLKTGTTEQKIRLARAKLFGKPPDKPAEKSAEKPAETELASEQARWNEASVPRPTARKSAIETMPLGRDRAIRAVRGDMKAQEENVNGETTTLDEFPG